MFENLGAPTGLRTRVVTFPFLESESKEELDQVREKAARRSEGVMIIVSPTPTKGILPAFLDLACAVSQLPIGTLFREEEVASHVWTDKPDCSFLEIQRVNHPFCVIGEISLT